MKEIKCLDVVGTSKEIGFIGFDYFDVCCNSCGNYVYNIPICKISVCPFCESNIISCYVCVDIDDCELASQLYSN